MARTHYRRVLITGASTGIGKALAYEFALSGSHVTLLARNTQALEGICVDLEAQSCTVHMLHCDVAIREDVERAIAFAIDRMGGVDLAILNAGRGNPEWMMDFTSSALKETFAVNVFGVAHAMEFLIPVMRAQGGGTIAGVSSLTDVRGYPGSGSYCATKAALSALLESARVELRDEGIHVVTIRPGFVKSPMTDKNEFPMPMIISAEKAARIIRRRLEKRHSVISFPFLYYLVSEIVRILPNWFYSRVAGKVRRK